LGVDWQERLRAYQADRVSGAMALADQAAWILEAWAQAAPAERMEDLRAGLEALLAALHTAHPDMAPPLHLAAAARRALAEAPDPPAARAALSAAARAFRERLEAHEEAAARHAAALLHRARVIMTHSRSGTVLRALAFLAREGHPLEVICPFSEPGGEGRRMAEDVAAQGHSALLLPDLVALQWLPEVDLVLVGADAWDAEGIVNKVGTRAIARLARAFGRPCWAVTVSEKRWPPEAGLHPARRPAPLPRSAEEARWFEFIPYAELTGLIREDGPHPGGPPP
jgi:translation initiation factor 2B subunit (eIF-2B alpha/beta/delta family)